jgi:hypothetical protein
MQLEMSSNNQKNVLEDVSEMAKEIWERHCEGTDVNNPIALFVDLLCQRLSMAGNHSVVKACVIFILT